MDVKDPCIIHPGITRRWVVSFMLCLLYPRKRVPATHWIRS